VHFFFLTRQVEHLAGPLEAVVGSLGGGDLVVDHLELAPRVVREPDRCVRRRRQAAGMRCICKAERDSRGQNSEGNNVPRAGLPTQLRNPLLYQLTLQQGDVGGVDVVDLLQAVAVLVRGQHQMLHKVLLPKRGMCQTGNFAAFRSALSISE
jgi:hypothetical protein